MADNDDKKVYMTKDGIFYALEGNEVTMYNMNKRIMETLSNLPGVQMRNSKLDDIEDFSLKDFYDAEKNSAFLICNLPYVEERLFYRTDDNKQIGIKYVLFDTETEESATRIIYRDTVGELMEIIYIIAHIGQEFHDKRGHVYKFGTIYGVNDVFSHYMDLVDDDGDLEKMRRVMFYIAGLIKGFCRTKAYNVEMMMNIIEQTIEDYHLSKITDDEEEGQ